MKHEQALPPVAELKSLTGRRVWFVGDEDDPWDVATGEVELKNPAAAYFVLHGKGKLPVDNRYFSFDCLLVHLDWEQIAALISDLPVCLIMTHSDMETGLCPTKDSPGWEWSLVEAFARLGSLPPSGEMSLPKVQDFPRSAETTNYLVAAFRRSIEQAVVDRASQAYADLAYIDKIHSGGLASP